MVIDAAGEQFAHASTTIDLRGLQDSCDAFVVTSGRTARQARAIALEIEHQVFILLGVVPGHVEGERDSHWILLDYGDVVVHVFDDEARDYYDLSHLWAGAPQRISGALAEVGA